MSGNMIIDGMMLVLVVVIFVYLFGGFLWDEHKRKKRQKAQAEMFERKMAELTADPEFDPNNFEIDLRTCEAFPELCIDTGEAGDAESEEVEPKELRRTHNGFGHEWER